MNGPRKLNYLLAKYQWIWTYSKTVEGNGTGNFVPIDNPKLRHMYGKVGY